MIVSINELSVQLQNIQAREDKLTGCIVNKNSPNILNRIRDRPNKEIGAIKLAEMRIILQLIHAQQACIWNRIYPEGPKDSKEMDKRIPDGEIRDTWTKICTHLKGNHR